MGASDLAMPQAKDSAGGSVMLPARSPDSVRKLSRKNLRAQKPTTNKGMVVMINPDRSQMSPWVLQTVWKNCAPALIPTQARKRVMPSSRKARLVLRGICQTRGPQCPNRPNRMAIMSGPPANPSRMADGMPGNAIGIKPTSTPRAIPANRGTNWVSWSS